MTKQKRNSLYKFRWTSWNIWRSTQPEKEIRFFLERDAETFYKRNKIRWRDIRNTLLAFFFFYLLKRIKFSSNKAIRKNLSKKFREYSVMRKFFLRKFLWKSNYCQKRLTSLQAVLPKHNIFLSTLQILII